MKDSDQPVSCRREGTTAIVTLSGKGNALNRASMTGLRDALIALRDDSGIRIVILTGAGTEGFSSGADLDELSGLDSDERLAFVKSGIEIADLIEAMTKPVIAALNGTAIGGGCEMALACHLRFAVEDATMVASELPLGLPPVFGFSRRLPRLVGTARALEMALTGVTLPANEALRLGLVNRVSRADSLMADSLSLAETLGRNAPLATKLALQAISQGRDLPLDDALEREGQLFSSCFATEDMREGVRAFFEKRVPEFKGK